MLTTLVSIFIVLAVVLLFVAALLIFRAMMFGRLPERVEAAQDVPAVEGPVVADHLAAAIRVQTVSYDEPGKINRAAFAKFHSLLERLYPRLHATLLRETVSENSLLYTWPGRAPELEPVLFYAHQDVVPADPATLDRWTHAPFAGDVEDGYVWGRGTLDMKGTLITLMESIEGLIKVGYQPERTLYLALGHDEEIGGVHGARLIAQLLAERGVTLSALLDEGSGIISGQMPGMGDIPVALVGVAEKGHATFDLHVEGRPGHSSMPPRHTAIGILARAVTRLEANPMPARLSLVEPMFAELGAFLPFSLRLALANTWLFKGAVIKRMQSGPQTNAMVRSTAAATVMQGGVKDNVVPAEAHVLVNCRTLPGDTVEQVSRHIHKTVDDEAVLIDLPEEAAWEASPISPTRSPVYESLSQTLRQAFPEAVVSPFLMPGATDSRHFNSLCASIYRVGPYLMDPSMLSAIHGIDERISIDNLTRMVEFYTLVIKRWTTVVGRAE